MAAITQTEVLVYEQDTGASRAATSPFGYKEILVEVPATADSGDTFTVTLADYGITTLKSIKVWNHTTDYNVLVLEAPTTSVTTGVLTVTLGGSSADNLRRTILIGGV